VLVWSRLHSLSFGTDLAAGWYASKSTLRLTDQAISALFQSDVTKLETYARGIFSGYDDYGCDAQMGSMSMIFALGPGGIHGFRVAAPRSELAIGLPLPISATCKGAAPRATSSLGRASWLRRRIRMTSTRCT